MLNQTNILSINMNLLLVHINEEAHGPHHSLPGNIHQKLMHITEHKIFQRPSKIPPPNEK